MKGNADSSARGRPDALRILATAAALALTVLALTGCSSGGSSPPQVASLGTSSGPGTSTSADPATSASSGTSSGSARATIAGNVTPLLNEWAACERSHGDPDQTDPTVSAGGVINILVPKGAQPAGNLHERTGTCSQYVAQAANELRAANPVAPPPDQAEYLKYVACMRANGVPNFPYPDGDQTNFNGTGVDPNSPAVVRVNDLCGKKLGLPTWWINGSEIPGDIEVQTAGVHYPLPDSSCAIAKNGCPGLVTVPGSGSGSGSNG
ncbi:MAG: hypothetical protein ACRDOB_05760 [Streptosporangiaceae bacterium]